RAGSVASTALAAGIDPSGWSYARSCQERNPSLCRLSEVAGDEVAGLPLHERRLLFRTHRLRERATGPEATAAGGMAGARQLAREEVRRFAREGIGFGNRIEERLRIGVAAWRRGEVLLASDLDDLPEIHHGDPVR